MDVLPVIRHTRREVDRGLGFRVMWERIILAGIATFCIYLFLNVGNNSKQTGFLKQSFLRTTHLVLEIPLSSWN